MNRCCPRIKSARDFVCSDHLSALRLTFVWAVGLERGWGPWWGYSCAVRVLLQLILCSTPHLVRKFFIMCVLNWDPSFHFPDNSDQLLGGGLLWEVEHVGIGYSHILIISWWTLAIYGISFSEFNCTLCNIFGDIFFNLDLCKALWLKVDRRIKWNVI